MCANMLANIGCEQGSSSIVYEQSLSLLRQALLSNVRARGFYLPHISARVVFFNLWALALFNSKKKTLLIKTRPSAI